MQCETGWKTVSSSINDEIGNINNINNLFLVNIIQMFAEIYRQKQLPEGACQKDVF